MKNLLFLLLLIPFVGQSQDTWNTCNSTVTISPAPAYDSTFVLEAPSRAALQKGMANWVPASSGGGSASYLVYTARLTQSGTSAPVAAVLENTLGGTVVWSRDNFGLYRGTLSGAFASTNKILVFSNAIRSVVNDALELIYHRPEESNSNSIAIQVRLINDEAYDLEGICYVEIRVYP